MQNNNQILKVNHGQDCVNCKKNTSAGKFFLQQGTIYKFPSWRNCTEHISTLGLEDLIGQKIRGPLLWRHSEVSQQSINRVALINDQRKKNHFFFFLKKKHTDLNAVCLCNSVSIITTWKRCCSCGRLLKGANKFLRLHFW